MTHTKCTSVLQTFNSKMVTQVISSTFPKTMMEVDSTMMGYLSRFLEPENHRERPTIQMISSGWIRSASG